MERMMNISLIELKKIIRKKEFFIGVLMILIMGGGMTYGAYIFPNNFGVQNVIAFYGNFASVLLMFIAAKCLGEEFDLKTVTFVFTSRSKRWQIISGKIISIVFANIVVGILGGLLYDVALIICTDNWSVESLVKSTLKIVLIYMIYGFAIGAAAVMFTCFINTTITPFVCLIVLFWLMPGILRIIAQKIPALAKALDYLVFCISDSFLMYQDSSVKNIVVFMLTGLVFSAIGLMAFERKDL